MTTSPLDISARIRDLWTRLAPKPGGRALFSWLIGRMAPYTGSVRPRVLELRAGYARVEMRDRRAVRNHLSSIHAIALANLAEVASGLAVLYGFPPATRGILIGFTIEYVKKARGTLVAECHCGAVNASAPVEREVEVVVRDGAGDVVARARPRWRIGPAVAAPAAPTATAAAAR